MSLRPVPFEGVLPALFVPFRTAILDREALTRELDFFQKAGVQGISVGGGLGELAGRTPEEIGAVCSWIRSHSDLPLAVTILPDSERESDDLLDAVCAAGADAILIAQPHYLFQPDVVALSAYFQRARMRTERPILLANTVASALVSPDAVGHLADAGLIDGVLQGGSDPHALVDVLALARRPPVFCGVEELAFTGLLLGAEGVLSTMAAVIPERYVALYHEMRHGDYESARKRHESLLRLWRSLDDPAEACSRLRYAAEAQGRVVGDAHAPFDVRSPRMVEEVIAALRRENVQVNSYGVL